jgi:hypothetical protein
LIGVPIDVLYLVLPFAAVARITAYFLAAGSQETLGSLVAWALALIAEAYLRAPMLWLALSALLVLPMVALISLAVRAGRRRRSRHSALRAARPASEPGNVTEEMSAATGVPATQQAWLTLEGKPSGPVALSGQVIRIGRHADNDLRLADRSVHRHHAVIERTVDEAFVIKDVSGKDGNGVRVNGERTERARLADGDVIELGRAKLRFENVPV